MDHIALERRDGSSLTDALVDMPQGLWSRDERSLTLLLHPGRIKTGLAAQRERGPGLPLHDWIRVVIGRGMRTAEGEPISRTVFDVWVGPPVHDSLKADLWRLEKDRLRLTSGAPIDVLSAKAHLHLRDEQGRPIPHSFHVNDDELVVHWDGAGPVEVLIDDRLEDVCGNRLTGPFERLSRRLE